MLFGVLVVVVGYGNAGGIHISNGLSLQGHAEIVPVKVEQ